MAQLPTPPAQYGDLTALYVNCTLTRSPGKSNTQGLLDRSIALMRTQGVAVDTIRYVDHDVPPGVSPDMREAGWERDPWPDELWPRVLAADILVIGSPTWLGDISSEARAFLERLYAMSDQENERGQYVFVGKVAGAIMTGNDDGYKHGNRELVYGLQHIGYTIPPTADSAWNGEAGPGPSYLDEGSGGPENDFTNMTTTFLTWNLLHLARLLKDAGGVPAYGNSASAWQDGERFGWE